ncbi:MAG: tRNA pseudouridine synthase [Bacteroidota bacterium]|jgi:tRNA pseudouridine55 synthase
MTLGRASSEVIEQWLEAARTDGAIALIDKQENWTSFDCVAKVRNLTRIKRVGHAGTLDPLATGLLVLCFGKATKDIESLQEGLKTYEVEIRLAADSTTDDRGGTITEHGCERIDDDAILQALMSFRGEISQTPPDYSAVRHQGRRQYDLAREGKDFTPKVRQVTIHDINNVSIDWPMVRCTIVCSRGTYIRSIARDLGRTLGCGGYVWSLRRTASGHHDVSQALSIDEVRTLLTPKEDA